MCNVTAMNSIATKKVRKNVLLSAALVHALDYNGAIQLIRVLLDAESHYNFITERAAQRLDLSNQSLNAIISGIGKDTTQSRYSIICIIKSCNTDFFAEIICLEN